MTSQFRLLILQIIFTRSKYCKDNVHVSTSLQYATTMFLLVLQDQANPHLLIHLSILFWAQNIKTILDTNSTMENSRKTFQLSIILKINGQSTIGCKKHPTALTLSILLAQILLRVRKAIKENWQLFLTRLSNLKKQTM